MKIESRIPPKISSEESQKQEHAEQIATAEREKLRAMHERQHRIIQDYMRILQLNRIESLKKSGLMNAWETSFTCSLKTWLNKNPCLTYRHAGLLILICKNLNVMEQELDMKHVPEQIKTWKEWIEKCLSARDRLTKWEEDFTESISEQLNERGSLSERQAEILERIYSEKTR